MGSIMWGKLGPESNPSERNPHRIPELTAIVKRVREFTNASGAAIALTSDQPGELDCCARSGPTAPEIGRSVVLEDSLTAFCIRSGKQLQCEDAEADPRVRDAAMFDLGVRSLVITPICRDNCVCGALAVFANSSHEFSVAHLAQLSAVANEIAEILWKSRTAEEKPLHNLLPFPASGIEAAKADANIKSDRERHPVEQPVQTSSLTPTISLARFPTFDGIGQTNRKFLPSNVILIAVAVLLVIVAAIWAALASHRPSLDSVKKIEPSGSIAMPQVDATTPDISTRTPADQAALRIEPPKPALRQGVSFALNVVFSHGRDISAVPMQINYDPKVLRFVDLSAGSFFYKHGQRAILLHRDDSASGTLKINAQLPPGASPISGDGTICRLVFVALEKGSGAISILASARNSHNKPVNVAGSRVAVTVN